jgi:chromate transporter
VSARSVSVAGVETAEAFGPHATPTLWELVRVFLYIGLAGFGGGMAIVAMIEDICVHKRRWMSAEEFAHGVAFGQFLGAFAVNTTTFVGYRIRGLAGAVAAVTAFLLPGVAVVIVITWFYLQYHSIPAMQSALHGIGPVVVAVLLSAAYRMGRSALGAALRAASEAGDAGGTPALREAAIRAAVEPAAIGVASFAALQFLKLPVILILLAVAVYGTVRYWMRRASTAEEDG